MITIGLGLWFQATAKSQGRSEAWIFVGGVLYQFVIRAIYGLFLPKAWPYGTGPAAMAFAMIPTLAGLLVVVGVWKVVFSDREGIPAGR
jgi:hypothetical protein